MSPTATCFCGAVQLAFSLEGDNFIGAVSRLILSAVRSHIPQVRLPLHRRPQNHILHVRLEFIIKDAALTQVRGQDKLTQFTMRKTIVSGDSMTNHFCSVCGSLMYRISSGFPGKAILRIGQVDDLHLRETRLRPWVKQFTKDRVNWVKEVEGMEQERDGYYGGKVKG